MHEIFHSKVVQNAYALIERFALHICIECETFELMFFTRILYSWEQNQFTNIYGKMRTNFVKKPNYFSYLAQESQFFFQQ